MSDKRSELLPTREERASAEAEPTTRVEYLREAVERELARTAKWEPHIIKLFEQVLAVLSIAPQTERPAASGNALREAAVQLLDALLVESEAVNLFDSQNAIKQVETAKERVRATLASSPAGLSVQ